MHSVTPKPSARQHRVSDPGVAAGRIEQTPLRRKPRCHASITIARAARSFTLPRDCAFDFREQPKALGYRFSSTSGVSPIRCKRMLERCGRRCAAAVLVRFSFPVKRPPLLRWAWLRLVRFDYADRADTSPEVRQQHAIGGRRVMEPS
jgi:hypothetical protein